MQRVSLALRPPTMAIAITATICAAGLVLYLQHRAIATLHSQTRVILRQLSEQTAVDIATELRRTLDGPVFETLTAVNHPELRAGRFDLVAQPFNRGLAAYPQVDRFFAWSAQTEREVPGEALFYGRERDSFVRDAALGRAVMNLAKQYAPTQQIYVAAENVGPAPGYQVFLRLFWNDARRLDYFAVLGFVVNPARVRDQLFGPGRTEWVNALLARRGEDVPLQLRVLDERGAVVYGSATGHAEGGRVPFQMHFYPDEIHPRLAARLEPRSWTIEVTAAHDSGSLASFTEGYGATAFSIVLMLVAVSLTVQAHRRSASLARMQSEFVAHVSHQLKTPLSLLSAATETLQMDRVRSPERFAEYLRTIHAEAARLSHLVQHVLEFSRVQQRHSYEFEEVDVAALVRETVDAFAHGLSNQHFTFDVEAEGPAPIVLADPAALEQVLVNLLDNAVKYSERTRTITVRVRTAGSYASVEVIDRGVGIAPADRAHIFERFFRGGGPNQRPGFGLGLTIVQELVHAHRGRVEVVSAPGAGATFRVMLPAHAVQRPASELPGDVSEVAS